MMHSHEYCVRGESISDMGAAAVGTDGGSGFGYLCWQAVVRGGVVVVMVEVLVVVGGGWVRV
jgi:hypothetical protein